MILKIVLKSCAQSVFVAFSMSVIAILTMGCGSSGGAQSQKNIVARAEDKILPGADQLTAYLPLLKGKKVGLMGNQTSVVGEEKEHLVDVLVREGVDLKFAFAPEHGFRGEIERGEKVSNETDEQTGLPLYTLYGGNERQDSIVASVDVMIFDLQDVGARFYTYITSLHRVMELCAKHNKELIVLDRPNPCGDQVDGPVRKDDKFKSGVSFHKIWDHSMKYELPVVPSPSLPNHLSVRLYSSLCLFEGTDISVGRGTDWPFQVVGYPDPVFGDFKFTPGEKSGMAKHVEGKGEVNYGLDLRGLNADKQQFTLKYVLDFYNKMPDKSKFFARPEFFDKLAGTDELRKQILAGMTESEIRKSWETDLNTYKTMRAKYLLYADFE
jgi:uncharacterized protein YbbC (DUF1343 family)